MPSAPLPDAREAGIVSFTIPFPLLCLDALVKLPSLHSPMGRDVLASSCCWYAVIFFYEKIFLGGCKKYIVGVPTMHACTHHQCVYYIKYNFRCKLPRAVRIEHPGRAALSALICIAYSVL